MRTDAYGCAATESLADLLAASRPTTVQMHRFIVATLELLAHRAQATVRFQIDDAPAFVRVPVDGLSLRSK